MIALLRQVADAGNTEGAQWAGMRIHMIQSEMMTDLGSSSKLNAEWAFLCMLRDEGRRAADVFLSEHGRISGGAPRSTSIAFCRAFDASNLALIIPFSSLTF